MYMIVDDMEVFMKILDVDWLRVVIDFEHIYFYRNWHDLVRDLSFERLLQHSKEQPK